MNKSMIVGMGMFYLLYSGGQAFAHCDTLDGPVVADARIALSKKDVTPVLKWILPSDEKIVKAAFKKAVLRTEGAEADTFFATVVKFHRKSEGASFEGLKPAGGVLEPGVRESDQAIASGSGDALVTVLQSKVSQGVKHRLDRVLETKKHKDDSVDAGRAYVRAYVEFVHYAERLASETHTEMSHKE